MLGVGATELKVFGGTILFIIIAWLLFHPIAEWTHIFWNYLNTVAPIMWLTQLFWPCFLAFLVMLGYMVVKRL